MSGHQAGRIMTWLRVNLAVLLAASGVLSGAVVGLVNATTQIVELRSLTNLHTQLLTGLHDDMISVDRRLNDQRQIEGEDRASNDKRLSLIEARLQWVLDRVPSVPSRR